MFKRYLLFSILSGICLALSFLFPICGGISWVGLVPLLFAVSKAKSFRLGFIYSYVCGVVFFSLSMYWLLYISFAGWLFVSMCLAVFFGVFGVVVKSMLDPGSDTSVRSWISCALCIPCAWVILEYLRSYLFTGLGWNLLAYSQYRFIPLIQIANITGVWGVSFLIVWANTILFFTLIPCRGREYPSPARGGLFRAFRECGGVLFGIVFISVLVYGYFQISSQTALNAKSSQQSRVGVSLIQGNIPQIEKWFPDNEEYIMAKYMSLSNAAYSDPIPGMRGRIPGMGEPAVPDISSYTEQHIIIWPETSYPGVLKSFDDKHFQNIRNFAKEKNVYVLVGAVRKKHTKYFNSALLIDPKAEVIQTYDKLHLVPFGEYIPISRKLAFLRGWAVRIGDFHPGHEYSIFPHSGNAGKLVPGTGLGFGVMICFEDIFPHIAREFVRRGAGFLVNMTNDAWFEYSPAPRQHLQNSVFRAVENKRYVVRAANTGITAIINPEGRIEWIFSKNVQGKNHQLFVEGFLNGSIKGNNIYTIYNKYGDVFVVLCGIIILFAVIDINNSKIRKIF